ncbi:MAG: MerR family transcriptional regulator [Bacilli bacterium]|nr:MerR family transcriptional regulator [Bacilli bacterium]
MYQISDFSKISHTSIQTLRYYDSLNLLKPSHINQENSYRYYTDDQLNELKVIRKLKTMGFTLIEISEIIKDYNEKYLIRQIENLKKQNNLNKVHIIELDSIVKCMKNNNTNVKKELISLINRKKETNMKENYEIARKKLVECYKMYKENQTSDCLVLLEEIKNDIFKAEESVDPFWSNSAGDLFTGITFEVFKNNDEKEVNFLNIFNFRIKGNDFINSIKEYTDKLDKDSYSYICLSNVSEAPNDTKLSIISVYKQYMKNYVIFETKN